jgi:hypothetical protein
MSLVAFIIATLLAHLGLGGLASAHAPATAQPHYASAGVRPMDSGGGMPFTQLSPPTVAPVQPTDSGGGMPFQ